jgi:hypothetical protein
MAKKRVSSNKAFRNSKKVKKGAGPVYLTTKGLPTEKKKNSGGFLTTDRVGCGGAFDNNVKYVYEINTDGNHLAYVDCEYVE